MPLPNDLGVLLVAHGTVQSLNEIPEFLLAIRRGRPPSPDLVSEMKHRYETIGGSPLLSVTKAQAALLSASLGRPVYVGMRFCRPSLEDAIREAVANGTSTLIVLPVAPYSVALYTAEVQQRLQAMPEGFDQRLELIGVTPWGMHPELVQAHCDNIQSHAGDCLARGAKLLLSAHSLPLRVIAAGDNYANEVASSAQAIGAKLGLPFALGYQSVGADGGQWLGPALESHLETLEQSPSREIVVAPFGFLSDHVETLYDLDVEFATRAHALGWSVRRVPALGTHPGLVRTLSSLVRASWLRREDPKNLRVEGTQL